MTASGSRTRVKICGLTALADALCAAEAGADFLGFVLYPRSPRFVTPDQVAVIVAGVRRHLGLDALRFVGVFVDEPVERVRATLDRAGLDLAQLHGSEPPAALAALPGRAFKAIRPQNRAEAEAALVTYTPPTGPGPFPGLLLDAYHPDRFGGTGLAADWALAADLARRTRLLLAGGLAPENVADAIARVLPWGVDVSSGVEHSPGVKDHDRVRAFIQAVRAADRAARRIDR
jgi:phosphoribosylanthranilate isomerase